MELISQYFDSLVFFRADQKEDFVIYAAEINSSFGDGKKQYALAFVPTHLAIKERSKLKDLTWRNFQTRILSNGWKLPKQHWNVPRGLPNPLFRLLERGEGSSTYHSMISSPSGDKVIEMILLNDPKKKSKIQYHPQMNLVAALATFRCLISVKMEENSYELIRHA